MVAELSRKYDSTGANSIPLAVSSLWTTFNVLSQGLVLIFVFPFSLFLLSHSEVMFFEIVRIFSPNDHFWAALTKLQQNKFGLVVFVVKLVQAFR